MTSPSKLTLVKHSELRLNEIVEELQGTCKTLDEVLTDKERDNEGLVEAIDECIFCCACCGWWCENSERHEDELDGEDVCEDCHDDR